MKAKKYPKVQQLPAGAMSVTTYAGLIGQKQPAYICVMYDRYLQGKGSNPGYTIVNWQGFNFVVPEAAG